MAKCLICHSRKGKKKCLRENGFICSLCCGQTRKKTTCVGGCPFFKEITVKRKYSEVPLYSPREMEASFQLQDYSNVIEGALCAYDNATGNYMKDDAAIEILELLINKYHFKDTTFEFTDNVIKRGFEEVNKAIEDDLNKIPKEEIIKVLAAIRFVANRRACGGRDYFSVIHDYVGERMGKGIRILPNKLFKIADRKL